jgi:hypothetical protein
MHTRTVLLIPLVLGASLAAGETDYFSIRVIDEQTGRGVPLVELRTVDAVRYYTDSAGLVAFFEPGLMDQEVFFFVSSHGYEYPADGFGMRGTRLKVRPGGQATLKIKRRNIAERLYRITGGGIYRDSVLLNQPVPIREPVLNGRVLGQDSIQSAIYQDKLFWFWGDTSWPSYPLGNFHMAGATSRLPSAGGLDPDVGIDLTYFVREDGFARKMAPRPEPGPVWLDAFVTLRNDSGRQEMYAAYARVTTSMEAVERGFMRYNDDEQVFEKVAEFDVNAAVRPGGHPFTCPDGDAEYVWFPTPFPLVRVRADAQAYLDLRQYEAWTPLAEGSTLDAPVIDRDTTGRIRYAWRSNAPALEQRHQNELVAAGVMKPEETWIHLQDADTGKAILAHAGSVYWNDYRRRWVTIRCEAMGTSMLGETWYAESDTPLGPWVYARRIVTHDTYSFYNPKHHPVFDQQNGRVIYFEGTYVNTFSGNPDKTPRYDYNQIMYRLDLADPRLVLPVPVYRDADGYSTARRETARAGGLASGDSELAFFALDRPREGAVPVFADRLEDGGFALRLGAQPGVPEPEHAEPCFYALPAQTEPRPATCVLLFEYMSDDGSRRLYATEQDAVSAGFRRADNPLCLVWRSPIRVAAHWREMRRRAMRPCSDP